MVTTLLAHEMKEVVDQIKSLVSLLEGPIIGIVAAVIAIWGIYIGIKIAVANKNEEKVNAKEMVKQLAIGILIGVILIAVGPLLVNILGTWAGVNTDAAMTQFLSIV